MNAPVWVQPGHAADAVTVHLGYGRTRAGRVAEGAGFNAYTLRTSDAPWAGFGAELRKTGDTYRLAGTQGHHSMENRNIVRAGTLEDFTHDPEFPRHLAHDAAEDDDAVPRLQVRGLQVGHGDRSDGLHRLFGLRRGLRGGEQHPGRREGSGAAGP